MIISAEIIISSFDIRIAGLSPFLLSLPRKRRVSIITTIMVGVDVQVALAIDSDMILTHPFVLSSCSPLLD